MVLTTLITQQEFSIFKRFLQSYTMSIYLSFGYHPKMNLSYSDTVVQTVRLQGLERKLDSAEKL